MLSQVLKKKTEKELVGAVKELGYRFMSKPFIHQIAQFLYLTKRPHSGLASEMGTGKTKSVCDAIRYRKQKDKIENTLVIAPNSILFNWRDEILKHTDLMPVVLQGVGAKTRKDKTKKLKEQGDIYIVSYESSWRIVDELRAKKFDMLVLSESHRIGYEGTNVTDELIELGAKIPFRLIETGTLFANHAEMVFSQFKFLDHGLTFGTKFDLFRGRFFKAEESSRYIPGKGKRHFNIWYFNKDREARFHNLIYKMLIRYTKDECFDLPPKSYELRFVDFTSEQSDIYRSYVSTTFAPTYRKRKLAKKHFIRLRQVCGGFMKTEDGDCVRFSKVPKLIELTKIIQDVVINNDEKLVVFHDFVEEGRMIAGLCAKMGIGYAECRGEIVDTEAQIKRFRGDKSCKIFISHPKSGGLGINLIEASVVCFYSNGFHLLHRMQAVDRLHRYGQVDNVTVIDLCYKNSVDEYVRESLLENRNFFDRVIDRDTHIENIIGKGWIK